jgi:hypothetical protein
MPELLVEFSEEIATDTTLQHKDLLLTIFNDALFTLEFGADEVTSCHGLQGEGGGEGISKGALCLLLSETDEVSSCLSLDFDEIAGSLGDDVVAFYNGFSDEFSTGGGLEGYD